MYSDNTASQKLFTISTNSVVSESVVVVLLAHMLNLLIYSESDGDDDVDATEHAMPNKTLCQVAAATTRRRHVNELADYTTVTACLPAGQSDRLLWSLIETMSSPRVLYK